MTVQSITDTSGSTGAAPMDMERVRQIISAGRWTFAKTMPQNPHEYVVRAKTLDAEAFVALATHIRAVGYTQRWGGKAYQYLDVDGYQYWTMGAPMSITIILNRARLKDAPAPAAAAAAVDKAAKTQVPAVDKTPKSQARAPAPAPVTYDAPKRTPKDDVDWPASPDAAFD